jgi:hypothetical protein
MTMTTATKIEVTVRYWVGTRQYEGKATTYRGAMRIARRNRNAYDPKFYDHEGKELYDTGFCLGYVETDSLGQGIAYV